MQNVQTLMMKETQEKPQSSSSLTLPPSYASQHLCPKPLSACWGPSRKQTQTGVTKQSLMEGLFTKYEKDKGHRKDDAAMMGYKSWQGELDLELQVQA